MLKGQGGNLLNSGRIETLHFTNLGSVLLEKGVYRQRIYPMKCFANLSRIHSMHSLPFQLELSQEPDQN